MFRPLLTAIALTLAACEGEPPKVPVNPPPGPANASPTASPPASAAPVTPGPAPTPPALAGEAAGCPCHCGVGEHGSAVSTAAAVSAAATAPPPAVAVAAQAGAAPTGTAELASIVGKVTTTPPRAAASAVVYLEDAPIVAGPAMTAAIDNRQMAFIPYVQVVPVGGRIVFNNSDPFPHNVFSPGKTGFNLGMVQAKNASAHVFNTPGVFPLLCNLHPNMLAFVVVTPSSYFAKANAKGEFTLKDVPAGTYKITAWAPREQPQTQSVVVQGSELALNFDLHK